MKKLLLISALAVSLGAQAAEVDVTPKNYHFNTATALPMCKAYPLDWGWNIPVAGYKGKGIDQYWNNGVIAFAGPKGKSEDVWAAMVDACQLVDFGGTVGKCFVFADKGVNLKARLKEATGYDYDIKTLGEGSDNIDQLSNPAGNLNFYLDPNTPTASTGKIHCKITYHVFVNTKDEAVAAGVTPVNKVYAVTDQNGQRPNSKASTSAGWTATNCWTYDEDTEESAWDPTKWNTVEWDFDVPDADKDATTNIYAPVRLKMEFPSPAHAIIIKDITLTHVEGELIAADKAGYEAYDGAARVTTPITLAFGEPSNSVGNVAADATAVNVSVNGNVVTLSADAQVYTVDGVKVANAKAQQGVNLASGLYVAVAGNQAVKFAVR